MVIADVSLDSTASKVKNKYKNVEEKIISQKFFFLYYVLYIKLNLWIFLSQNEFSVKNNGKIAPFALIRSCFKNRTKKYNIWWYIVQSKHTHIGRVKKWNSIGFDAYKFKEILLTIWSISSQKTKESPFSLILITIVL